MTCSQATSATVDPYGDDLIVFQAGSEVVARLSDPDSNPLAALVENGGAIAADAITGGDGGEVIVWADENTRYYGAISARGGAGGGDGGSVEISGKQNLAFFGTADASAPLGSAGQILLDPNDIVIVASVGYWLPARTRARTAPRSGSRTPVSRRC